MLWHRLERQFGVRGVVLACMVRVLAFSSLLWRQYVVGDFHCLLGSATVGPRSEIIRALHCGPPDMIQLNTMK